MKVVGTRDIFTRSELTDFMRAKIIEYSKTELAKTIDDQKISILSITSHMAELSELMQGKLTEYFDQFGTKHSLNVSTTAGIVMWEMAKTLLIDPPGDEA